MVQKLQQEFAARPALVTTCVARSVAYLAASLRSRKFTFADLLRWSLASALLAFAMMKVAHGFVDGPLLVASLHGGAALFEVSIAVALVLSRHWCLPAVVLVYSGAAAAAGRVLVSAETSSAVVTADGHSWQSYCACLGAVRLTEKDRLGLLLAVALSASVLGVLMFVQRHREAPMHRSLLHSGTRILVLVALAVSAKWLFERKILLIS